MAVLPGLQFRGDLLDLVTLDHVAGLDVLEIFQPQAAFAAGFDFLGVVLEMPEAADATLVLDRAPPQKADAAGARDAAVGDVTAGDFRSFREFENLPDLGVADDDFLGLDRKSTRLNSSHRT